MRWSKRVRDSVISSSTGPLNCDDLALAAADHAARRGARRRRLPRVEHAPRPGHAQVRVDRQPALEAQEQVLAVGVDRAHGAARPGAPASGRAPKRGCGVSSASGTWPSSTGRMRFAA